MAPTVFRRFAGSLSGDERFPELRLVCLVGEPVLKTDFGLYQQHLHSDCIFVNSLGGTETSFFRMYFADKQTRITRRTVPVGYSVQDKQVLILDEQGEDIGYNRIGEIAVRSRYIFSGYWQRPDLTEAALLQGAEGDGQRIYRTGDLGRMLADGCLEHMGRKDFQVKIRGHRVEMAEIESALLELGEVKESVVMAREDRPGEQRLVAYVVPRIEPTPTANSLRRALAAKLPEYMIPAVYVMLPVLPQTPNGKIDRSRLPAPETTRPALDQPFVAPRTPVEQKVALIWADVLGLDKVGIHDDFADVGGDSLKATQIISRVIAAFRVNLPLRSFFEAPSIAKMAGVIADHQEQLPSAPNREVLPDEEL